MKNVIEASIYLIIMTLICYISIDFVIMNQRISKINEVTQYIEDYIEIYGTAESTGIDPEGKEQYRLDAYTLNHIENQAQSNHMKLSYDYENKTNDYIYFNVNLEYSLSTSMFKMNRTHTYHGFGRVCI